MTSDFTNVTARIEDRVLTAEVSAADAWGMRIEHGEKVGCMAPISLDPARKKAREKSTTRPASHKGCLSMTLDQYLKSSDWTVRQLRKDQVGAVSEECAPILERLDCSAETWGDFVKNFRERFRGEAGLS